MKTTVYLCVISVLCMFANACGSKTELKEGDTVSVPDTIAFKDSWQMEEHMMLADLFAKDTLYKELGLDTFELSYWPNYGPDWIDFAKRPLQCKECSDFYIEPADSSLLLPESFYYTKNTVTFYGVRVPEMRIPEMRMFVNQDTPPWTVIRYYGYQVKRPYNIWVPGLLVFINNRRTDIRRIPVLIQ